MRCGAIRQARRHAMPASSTGPPGCLSGGHLRRRRLNRTSLYAFRRPTPHLPRRESNRRLHGVREMQLPGLQRSDARLQPPPGRASSDGTVATGSLTAVVGANGSGKSTLMKGIVGVLKPMDGDDRQRARRPHRLSAAAIRARPHLSGARRRPGVARRLAEARAARPLHRRGPRVGVEGAVGGRPRRLREAADRHAVGRPVAAHAVRARAGAGRRDHPARRAVQRDRRQDRRRPDRADQALARREPHHHGRRPRPQSGARAFSRDAAARPPAGRLGRHDRDAAAGEPAARPPLRRGLARRRAVVRARRRDARARSCACSRPRARSRSRPRSPPPSPVRRRADQPCTTI